MPHHLPSGRRSRLAGAAAAATAVLALLAAIGLGSRLRDRPEHPRPAVDGRGTATVDGLRWRVRSVRAADRVADEPSRRGVFVVVEVGVANPGRRTAAVSADAVALRIAGTSITASMSGTLASDHPLPAADVPAGSEAGGEVAFDVPDAVAGRPARLCVASVHDGRVACLRLPPARR